MSFILGVLQDLIQVVIDREAQAIADELREVLEQHGLNYEAPAWRALVERGEAVGVEFEIRQPFWLEEQ